LPYLQRHKKPLLWIWFVRTTSSVSRKSEIVIADNVNFESIDVSLATTDKSSPAPKDADETGL